MTRAPHPSHCDCRLCTGIGIRTTPPAAAPPLPDRGKIVSPRERPSLVVAAADAGCHSPCLKSRRGVAIWDEDGLISTGWNHQPGPFKCDGSAACKQNCNKLCVHAEAHALLRAGHRARGAHMLHVKVDENAVGRPGGEPSCWQCSRLILAAGISVMWLLETNRGWVSYSASDFHRVTLENLDLQPAPQR